MADYILHLTPCDDIEGATVTTFTQPDAFGTGTVTTTTSNDNPHSALEDAHIMAGELEAEGYDAEVISEIDELLNL